MGATEEKTIDIFGATLTRSKFVKGAGALVVGLSVVGTGLDAKAAKASTTVGVPLLPGSAHSPDASQPGSWFTINADNTITMRTGIAEMGQGSASTAFAQIAADELNVPYSAITNVVIGDTDRTPGGGIAAGFMFLGAPNIRKVAAYMYQTMLSMASTQFGVPVANLTVKDGVISGGGKSVTYGQLVTGQGLNLTIPVTGDPTSFLGLTVLGNPPVKPMSQYQVVGQSIPMRTIPAIVSGSATYVGDVRLPGMLHARPVHPPALGATLIQAGTLDKKRFPNTQIIVKGNLVAVIDPEEYTAIEAASLVARTTKWTAWAGLPGSDNLFSGMRNLDYASTPPSYGVNVGSTGAAFAGAAKKLSATYQFPVEKHAPIGPTVAVGDVRQDGTVWVHMHGQNPSMLRAEIALMLGIPTDKVIIRWYDGSGHYGRSNGGNTGAEEEAVILSQIVGKPVRVQWMRWDDMQWSTQHPPVQGDVQAGLDASGKLVSFNATYYSTAGQDDRPVGAILAGLPTMPAPAVVPPAGSFSGTSNGISDPWMYDQVPNALQTGFGSWNMGSNGKDPELPAGGRPPRAQHAHARSASAELRSGVDDERACRRGRCRPDSVPHQQHDRPAADHGAQRREGRRGLGNAAVAEPEGCNHWVDPGGRSGLQRNASVACLLGVRCSGVDRAEDREDHGDERHHGSRSRSRRQPIPAQADVGRRYGHGSQRDPARAGSLQQGRNHRPRLGHLPHPSDHGAAEDQDGDHQQPERRCHRLGR